MARRECVVVLVVLGGCAVDPAPAGDGGTDAAEQDAAAGDRADAGTEALLVADGDPAGPCDAPVLRWRSPSGVTGYSVRPSTTDPAITDASASGSGFGYHVVAVPASEPRGTLLWFVGSHGRPFHPDSCGSGSDVIVEEAALAGYYTIALAHANEESVGSRCRDDGACYERVRGDVVHGGASPELDVAPADSIDHRLEALLAWLPTVGLPLPPATEGTSLDWSRVRLGGQSQGGGHAAFIAQESTVERVCMLGSVVDAVGAGDGFAPADWLLDPWATPLDRRRGLVHEEDAFRAKILVNYGALGMQRDVHFRELIGGTPEGSGDGHGLPPRLDMFAPDRAWACFE